MSETVLITGGAGFVGAHIIEHLYVNTDWHIITLDRLSYAGTLHRLTAFGNNSRVSFVHHDLCSPLPAYIEARLHHVTCVIHNAAESHVERSLANPAPFILSNVVGTMNLLQWARTRPSLKCFLYTSTDEVHGPAAPGVYFKEDATIRPSNPYAASKAGAEALVYAWARSYGLPAVITRCMNMFGERQHPEKFVPMVIRSVMCGETVKIHAAGSKQIGSRKWLHARNEASAVLFILRLMGLSSPSSQGARFAPVLHIAGEEHTNLEVAELIAQVVGRALIYELVDFHSTRPGHDLRYSLDDTRLRSLGWEPPVPFQESLERTVKWTLAHPEWLGG